MTNNPQQDYRALLKRSLATIDNLQAKVDELENAKNEPVAIVGMGCRFPGGANDPEAFWHLLHDGVDAVTEVPADRWDWREYYDPNPDAVGKAYTKWGGFIDHVDHFDPLFFGITPREAVSMDPQQRILLEVTWEALENGGFAPDKLAGSSTGVYVGLSTYDYSQMVFKTGSMDVDAYFSSGTAHSIAAGRLSYILGLHGPNLAVDTACSSALTAVHLAVHALRQRDCDMAIAGGVCLVLSPDGAVMTSRARMMSFDGRCKTFDASADGYVRGEGCGMIVLKRLADAVADGDNVLAVIRGTAINQDGRSNGLTAPNGAAQEMVLRAALQNANVKPTDVSYIEAHGTGTSLGDPIEISALGTIYGAGRTADNPLMVGSVKTNTGHLEAAAGIIGLIKIVLAMQHRTIPPHLHLKEPNPLIPWDSFPVTVPTEATTWQPPHGKLFAGLSSFGFSGTNAHVIIEESPLPLAPSPFRREGEQEGTERPLHILALSGRNANARTDLAGRAETYLTRNAHQSLADVAYTANVGRSHFEERLAVIAANGDEARDALSAWLRGEAPVNVIEGTAAGENPPEVVFLFTGQGAQYAGMGRDLYETQPVFRRALDRCDTILREHLNGTSILDIIFGDDGRIDLTQYTQPALFALEYGLGMLWRSWGIRPSAVMGHSVGEYVAACVAGLFSLEDGLKLIAARGRLMGGLPAGGVMAAVFANAETVIKAVEPYANEVSIAAFNGPENTVISGTEGAVQAVLDSLKGVKSQRLTVSHAFHSPLMNPILDEFEQVAASLNFQPPQLAIISNATGQVADYEIMTARYWRDHLRQPVHFEQSITGAYASGNRVFLEIGPHPTLLGMARRCLPDDTGALWLPSLRKGRPDWSVVLESLGHLYANGADINWVGFDKDYARHKLTLPTYPFQKRRFWLEIESQHSAGKPTGHPLLGNRLTTPTPIFETRLGMSAFPYLNDHRINGQPFFPATGYDEVALAAARQYFGEGAHILEDVVIQVPLIVPTDGTITAQIVLTPTADGEARFEVFSRTDDNWTRHATGNMRATRESPLQKVDLDDIRARCDQQIDAQEYYTQLRAVGADYGPTFQGIRELWRHDGESLGHIQIIGSTEGYTVHPALLDSCLQLIGQALPGMDGDSGDIYVPVMQGRVQVFEAVGDSAWGHFTLHPQEEANRLKGDLRVLDDSGRVLVEITNLQLQKISSASPVLDWFYDMAWLPQARAGTTTVEGNWVIFGDAKGLGENLADLLKHQGANCTVLYPDDDTTPALSAANNVVYLWGMDAPQGKMALNTLQDYEEHVVGGALRAVKKMADGVRLTIVTRGATPASGTSPNIVQAPLWGFGAVIATERPDLHCKMIDIDSVDTDSLFAEILADDGEDRIALRGHDRLVSRMIRSKSAPVEEGEWALEITERGILDNLYLETVGRQAPGFNQVEIEVLVSGLNFRDVLNAMGMYPGPPGPLGNEVAGRIIAVGEGVDDLKVGDEVIAMTPRAFASTVVAEADLTVRKPANLTLEQAATIPVAFLTADYSLNNIGHMKAGDRVLIHAAAGGVGMAAVQLARLAGAEIFGTASTDEKRGVAAALGAHHLMNSRTLDFADEIAQITNGEGVDIVLNSLANEFIPKSLQSMRVNGRFIEIGKTGVWDAEEAGKLVPGLEYTVFYLGDVAARDSKLIKRMLVNMVEAFESGVLQPLPTHVYSMNEVGEAFRFMAQGKHIGKVVVTNPARPVGSAEIKPDVTYLITGGTGGLGLAVGRWLVEQGARNIVLMSRRAPNGEAQTAIADMEAKGAQILTAQVDVSQENDVAGLLNHIEATMPPLRGVIHTAGVLDDGVISAQTWARFQKVFAPKLDGAYILHNLTQDIPLDFFVLFSGGAAVFGSPGQSNYAAANAFLDGLAHARRAQGLPALSINWGAWADVGMAAGLDSAQRQRIADNGMGFIKPRLGVQAMGEAMRRDATQLVIAPIDWGKLIRAADNNPPPLLAILAQESTTETATQPADGVLAELRSAPEADKPDLTLAYIQGQIARIMRLGGAAQVDPALSLNQLGIDSLMAVELRNRLKTDLGVEVSVGDLLQGPSVRQLVRTVLGKMSDTGNGAAAHEASVQESSEPASLLQSLDQMSDEDVDALLGQMLSEQDE